MTKPFPHAVCQIQLGLALDIIHALDATDASTIAPPKGTKGGGRRGRQRSLAHFEHAAELDGTMWSVWQLWAEALREEARR